MDDDGGNPMIEFAFHDLDYIPFGYGGTTAPYIETSGGTMRAAATLMCLGGDKVALTAGQEAATTVVCDLGCGDVIGLLSHINGLTKSISTANGVGIDYNAELINTAGINSKAAGVNAEWLIYDFNNDLDDLVDQLITTHQVTHVFIYLVPKQLALETVRNILTKLARSGVVLCCHKFFPLYLKPARRDVLMDLVVYDETSCEVVVSVALET
ncbi:hypothetical protein LSUE1_G000440 [Lachnellula suecica]|uniref:Methyltransferase domain-containing protein n=1 Tax=Lachnellula suecica TaxID=602035 RepID=A0A8T9CI38_9HELO|nr:hypothetical protein LSUE1_G000440 [Lachnellula suecica]